MPEILQLPSFRTKYNEGEITPRQIYIYTSYRHIMSVVCTTRLKMERQKLDVFKIAYWPLPFY